MERFLQPMSEGRALHARPSQWEASVPKATTEPLRGAGLRDASTHPPRRLVQSRGRPPQGRARWDVRPSSNPEASPSERFPRPAGEGKDKSRWEPSRKKEKERKPRLACWRSRLPVGARLVWSVPVLAGVRCVVPGPWCLVPCCGGGFESRHRTSSTRPHEADRCKNRPLPSSRLSLPSRRAK